MTEKISHLLVYIPLLAILLVAFMIVVSVNGIAEMYYYFMGEL